MQVDFHRNQCENVYIHILTKTDISIAGKFRIKRKFFMSHEIQYNK
jgi:hypothetical protein